VCLVAGLFSLTWSWLLRLWCWVRLYTVVHRLIKAPAVTTHTLSASMLACAICSVILSLILQTTAINNDYSTPSCPKEATLAACSSPSCSRREMRRTGNEVGHNDHSDSQMEEVPFPPVSAFIGGAPHLGEGPLVRPGVV